VLSWFLFRHPYSCWRQTATAVSIAIALLLSSVVDGCLQRTRISYLLELSCVWPLNGVAVPEIASYLIHGVWKKLTSGTAYGDYWVNHVFLVSPERQPVQQPCFFVWNVCCVFLGRVHAWSTRCTRVVCVNFSLTFVSHDVSLSLCIRNYLHVYALKRLQHISAPRPQVSLVKSSIILIIAGSWKWLKHSIGWLLRSRCIRSEVICNRLHNLTLKILQKLVTYELFGETAKILNRRRSPRVLCLSLIDGCKILVYVVASSRRQRLSRSLPKSKESLRICCSFFCASKKTGYLSHFDGINVSYVMVNANLHIVSATIYRQFWHSADSSRFLHRL
jgi:hypothetical protein